MSGASKNTGSARSDPARASGHVDQAVGSQIRRIREVRGVQVEDLAKSADISLTLARHIEDGRSSASIRILRCFADALNVEIGDFFGPAVGAGPMRSSVVTRHDQKEIERLDRGGAIREWVTPRPDGERLGLNVLCLEPGAWLREVAGTNGSVNAGYVLDGGIELELPDRAYLLGVHDAFALRGDQNFLLSNAGGRAARIFWARFVTDGPPTPPAYDPENSIP